MINADDCSVLLNDISEYAEIDEKKVVATILKSSIAFFLDTCFITRLRLLKEDKRYSYFSKFVDEGEDICFVITGMVLYELKDSQEDKIQEDSKVILEEMRQKGFKLVILLEERIISCLKDFTGYSAVEWKGIFDKTICENKAILRKFTSIVETDGKIISIVNKKTVAFETLENLIRGIKKHKKNKDSLADELIILCFVFLLRLPGRTKYCYCTNDYPAIANLNKCMENTYRNQNDRVIILDYFNLIKELYICENLLNADKEWAIKLVQSSIGNSIHIFYDRNDGFMPVQMEVSAEKLIGFFESGMDINLGWPIGHRNIN